MFVLDFCLYGPLVSVLQHNSHISAAKQTSMGHHLSAVLKFHLALSSHFSVVRTRVGISPCVPSPGPYVSPLLGWCSEGWSQHESYFWLSGYLILHNPQRFRPRSFGLVHERHIRESDSPFPRAPPELGSCEGSASGSGSSLRSPTGTFWAQLNFANNPGEIFPNNWYPSLFGTCVELQNSGCRKFEHSLPPYHPVPSLMWGCLSWRHLRSPMSGEDLCLS